MVEEERQRIPRRNIYIYVNVIKHFVLSFTFFWKFSGRSKCFIEPKIIRKWKRYLLERGVVVVTRSKIRGKKKLHGVKNSSSIRTSQWSVRTIIFHRSLYLSFFSSPSFFFPDTRRLSKTHYHALWYTDGKKKNISLFDPPRTLRLFLRERFDKRND